MSDGWVVVTRKGSRRKKGKSLADSGGSARSDLGKTFSKTERKLQEQTENTLRERYTQIRQFNAAFLRRDVQQIKRFVDHTVRRIHEHNWQKWVPMGAVVECLSRSIATLVASHLQQTGKDSCAVHLVPVSMGVGTFTPRDSIPEPSRDTTTTTTPRELCCLCGLRTPPTTPLTDCAGAISSCSGERGRDQPDIHYGTTERSSQLQHAWFTTVVSMLAKQLPECGFGVHSVVSCEHVGYDPMWTVWDRCVMRRVGVRSIGENTLGAWAADDSLRPSLKLLTCPSCGQRDGVCSKTSSPEGSEKPSLTRDEKSSVTSGEKKPVEGPGDSDSVALESVRASLTPPSHDSQDSICSKVDGTEQSSEERKLNVSAGSSSQPPHILRIPIIFMPHCPRLLYATVVSHLRSLAQDGSPLGRCLLLGNRISWLDDGGHGDLEETLARWREQGAGSKITATLHLTADGVEEVSSDSADLEAAQQGWRVHQAHIPVCGPYSVSGTQNSESFHLVAKLSRKSLVKREKRFRREHSAWYAALHDMAIMSFTSVSHKKTGKRS